ncbi:MAG: glycosyltransferase, partial [Candidatus Saliniplasma sp.]
MRERKVSVVINLYNEEENIRDCLNSLADQTYSDFELIIVDDGSTDDTMDIVKDYSDVFDM